MVSSTAAAAGSLATGSGSAATAAIGSAAAVDSGVSEAALSGTAPGSARMAVTTVGVIPSLASRFSLGGRRGPLASVSPAMPALRSPRSQASMPMPISRSPMITTSAPSRRRCSSSSAECARAMMRTEGLSWRPTSQIVPASKPLGMAISRHLAAGRLASLSTSARAALPSTVSMPSSRAAVTKWSVSSISTSGAPASCRLAPTTRPTRPKPTRTVCPVCSEGATLSSSIGSSASVTPGSGMVSGAVAASAPGSTRTSSAPWRAALRSAARASRAGLARSTAQKTSGLSTMEISAPARIRSWPSRGRMASATPMLARMKENSPICASEAEMVSAVPIGRLNSSTMAKAASDLPMTMMNTVASTGSGLVMMIEGSNSMPTDTKNSTAKASRSGNVSWAARWDNSLSDRIMPAKKAPSASDTPKSSAEPSATPSAMASTASRNSSRLPVWAVPCSAQGMTRRPTTSMKPTKAATLSTVSPNMPQTPISTPARRVTKDTKGSCTPVSPLRLAMAGTMTSASTMARSSTISQPTAMRPRSVSIRRRSCRALSSTTVDATDKARPNSRPAPRLQPIRLARPRPSNVAKPICTRAPGMASARTLIRSLSEKCSPTPNIKRITPSSASSAPSAWSATKPGV